MNNIRFCENFKNKTDFEFKEIRYKIKCQTKFATFVIKNLAL
jgi:hypothetical protein